MQCFLFFWDAFKRKAGKAGMNGAGCSLSQSATPGLQRTRCVKSHYVIGFWCEYSEAFCLMTCQAETWTRNFNGVKDIIIFLSRLPLAQITMYTDTKQRGSHINQRRCHGFTDLVAKRQRFKQSNKNSSQNNRWAKTPNYSVGASVEYRRWRREHKNSESERLASAAKLRREDKIFIIEMGSNMGNRDAEK